MTATYTFDVFSSLDGFGSYNSDGDWGGYWGKQGPEFLDHRLAVISEEQRMVLGANTLREFLQFLGPSTEESEVSDPVNTRMRNLPTTVVSTLLAEVPAGARSTAWLALRLAAAVRTTPSESISPV